HDGSRKFHAEVDGREDARLVTFDAHGVDAAGLHRIRVAGGDVRARFVAEAAFEDEHRFAPRVTVAREDEPGAEAREARPRAPASAGPGVMVTERTPGKPGRFQADGSAARVSSRTTAASSRAQSSPSRA